MEDWHTIWDHEVATFGKRSVVFAGTTGAYRVEVDEQNQDQVLVTYKNGPLPWVVFTKSVRDGVYCLQGMTGGQGDPYDDGGGWFELILSKPAIMRFWGDQVLVHEDHEIDADASAA